MKNRMPDGNLMRDLGLLLFLVCILGILLLVTLSPPETRLAYLLMTGVAFAAAVLAFFGRTAMGVLVAGTQAVAWTAYKLYRLYAMGFPLYAGDVLWLPGALLLVGGVSLFQYGSSRLERENVALRDQVEDLVTVDALTGLYNLRALYREWPMQWSAAARHGTPLSLMIIQLRYAQELRSFLSQRQYSALCQRMASLVQEHLRLEDRLYALEEPGMLGLLLMTDQAGCEVVKTRLRGVIETPDAFQGIAEENILVSVRIAAKQADEQLGKNPMDLKKRVESELQYDV